MRTVTRHVRPHVRIHAATRSPRLRLAVRLYETGLVPTKAQAARVAKLEPITLYQHYRPGYTEPRMAQEIIAARRLMDEHVGDAAKLIEQASTQAIKTLVDMMQNSSVEMIRFKAAQDLADRGKRTSKTQRIHAEGFTLEGKDVKELAAALVNSRRRISAAAEGDFICVKDVDAPALPPGES